MPAEPGITQIHKQKVQAGMCPLMSQVGTWKIPVRYKAKKFFTMTVVKYSTSHPERLWDFPSSELLKAGLNKSLSNLILVQLKVGLSCPRSASQPKLFIGSLSKLPDLFIPLFLPSPPHCPAFSLTQLLLQEDGFPLLSRNPQAVDFRIPIILSGLRSFQATFFSRLSGHLPIPAP